MPSARPSRSRSPLLALVALTALSAVGAGCDEGNQTPSDSDLAVLQPMELAATELPASPTNAYADSTAAALLGRRLFFDKGLSSNGTVACVDCHDPDLGFSDDRERSLGTEGQPGGRHSMPVTTVALQPFALWDGRADSAWRQPLFAMENRKEMDFSRAEVAHYLESQHRAEYEAAFGPMPALDGVPERAFPGDPAWDSLASAKQDAVQRVFVNAGKAIEAYERNLVCADTRFDQWVRGEIELDAAELDGAARFARAGCAGCHNGPAVSDGKFHNLGLSPAGVAAPDTGREAGLAVLLADPLNGASVYSDDPAAGSAKLAETSLETSTRGAFRTASLRGVAQRPRFGHLGAQTDLEEFIDDTYRGGGGRGGGRNGGGNFIGSRDPLLQDVEVDGGDAQAIATFLRTLDCPTLPADELAP